MRKITLVLVLTVFLCVYVFSQNTERDTIKHSTVQDTTVVLEQQKSIENTEITEPVRNRWYSDVALGLRAGTLGFGGEINKAFARKFCARLNFSAFGYSTNLELEDENLTSDIDVSLGAISLLGDWYFLRNIHLTLGVSYNLFEATVDARRTEDLELGTITVTEEEFGDLGVKTKPNRLNPYIGIGFGRSQSYKRRLAFNFELGALYQGKTNFELKSSGMLTPTATPEQEEALEDSIYLPWYPVMTFQITYKIF